MADKDVTGILTPILPLAKEFVTVRANLPAPCPLKSWAVRITALGGKAQAAPSIPDGVALAQSLAGDHGPVCALGTLYFSADVPPRHWPSRAIEIPYNLAIQIPV